MKHCLATVLLAFCLNAGAVEAISGTFTVDTTAPTRVAVVAPLDNASVSAPFLRLSVSASDLLSGIALYEFEIDGNVEGTGNSWFVAAAEAGSITWRARATDLAGNVGEWSAASTVTFASGDDEDEDGLADSWELALFGSLEATDGATDSDGDGASDLEELLAGTHPLELTLSLQPGWNMLALPLDTTGEDAETIVLDDLGITLEQVNASELVAAADGPLWIWDAPFPRYGATTAPQARQGLWIFSAEGVEALRVSGRPAADSLLLLEKGWNLAGAGRVSAPEDTEGMLSIQAWTNGAYQFHTPDGDFRFDRIQGYWIYSGNAQGKNLR